MAGICQPYNSCCNVILMYHFVHFIWYTATGYGNCHRLLCIGLLNIIMLYTFVISLYKQFGNKVTYVLTYFQNIKLHLWLRVYHVLHVHVTSSIIALYSYYSHKENDSTIARLFWETVFYVSVIMQTSVCWLTKSYLTMLTLYLTFASEAVEWQWKPRSGLCIRQLLVYHSVFCCFLFCFSSPCFRSKVLLLFCGCQLSSGPTMLLKSQVEVNE